jgi:MFS family permease
MLAVLAALLLKEKPATTPRPKVTTPFFSFLKYWQTGPAAYRQLVTGLLVFTLFNSSDVFLLLQAKQSGLDDTMVIGVYIFYNLVYALLAYPIGILADKMRLKATFIVGLALFAIVYFGMSFNTHLYIFFGLFFLYGIYAAATEGISKAWISNITAPQDTATAIGTYSGLQSICALVASSLTGFLWYQFGSFTALLVIGLTTLLVIGYFLTIPDPRKAVA